MSRQLLVLCGGRGTRMAAASEMAQKCLMAVMGRPFLCHVLDAARMWDVDEVLLLGGHRGDDVMAVVRDLPQQPFAVRCCIEERPLGTLGAVRAMARDLDETFLLALGDVHPPLGADVGEQLDTVLARTAAYTVMASAPEYESLDQGNLTVDGDLVVSYDKSVGAPLIDRGLRLMTRAGLSEHGGDSDTAYFGGLVAARRLAHCVIPGRVFDIGTPDRLRAVRKAFARGVPHEPSKARRIAT